MSAPNRSALFDIGIVSLRGRRTGARGAGGSSSSLTRRRSDNSLRLRDVAADVLGALALFVLLWVGLVAGAVLG